MLGFLVCDAGGRGAAGGRGREYGLRGSAAAPRTSSPPRGVSSSGVHTWRPDGPSLTASSEPPPSRSQVASASGGSAACSGCTETILCQEWNALAPETPR